MIGDNDDTEENKDTEDSDLDETEADDDGPIVEGAHETTVVDADVESLVARIDNTDEDEGARKRAIRRRLEDMQEERDSDLDSTFNFNMEDEL